MITSCNNTGYTRETLMDYLGDSYNRVPYLYTNLYTYGTDSPVCSTWVDVEDGQLRAVYLQYRTCLHFFSRDEAYPVASYIDFMQGRDVRVAIVTEEFGMRLMSAIHPKKCLKECCLKGDTTQPSTPDLDVVRTTRREDFPRIVDCMMTETMYSEINTREGLLTQLLERFDAGYGRSFHIEVDGAIAASYGISGENDKFIFTASLIVNPAMRGRGFAPLLTRALWRYAGAKGKESYCFVDEENEASIRMHTKCGATVAGRIMKFYF